MTLASLDKTAVRAAVSLEGFIASRLGETPRKVSGAEVAVRCPFHDDGSPSLHINNAKQTWICRVCPDTGGDVFTFIQRYDNVSFVEALRVAADFAGIAPPSPPASNGQSIEAVYQYKDEQGALLYEVCRFGPKKHFRQRGPTGVWSLPPDVRRVIYGLEKLVSQRPADIVVVEGEKDVERLWDAGIAATCNAGGAGKWRDENSMQLRDCGVQRVVIIPDNDAAGCQHRERVAGSCANAGLQVLVLDPLPGSVQGGDATDFLATHTADELQALVANARPYQAALTSASSSSADLKLTSLADLLSKPDEEYRWVVADRIPAGAITLIAGKPKAGKSTLGRDLALAISRGEAWLGWATTQGRVWYCAFEEKETEVKRHFKDMGATAAEPIELFIDRAPEDVLALLLEKARREKPIAIVIDTLQLAIRCSDMNDYAEVNGRMEPLRELARKTDAAVIALHHAGKGMRTGIDGVLGSTALSGAADNVFMLARSEDSTRVLSSEQRVGTELEPTLLTFDPVARRLSIGPTKKEAEHTACESQILSVLERADAPMSERDLSAEVEARTAVKRRALRRLCEDRHIQREGNGSKGNAYRYSLPGRAPKAKGQAA